MRPQPRHPRLAKCLSAISLVLALSASSTVFAQERYVGAPVAPLKVKGDPGQQRVVPNQPAREIPEGRPEREPQGTPPAQARPHDPTVQLRGNRRTVATSALSGVPETDVVVSGLTGNTFPPDTVGDVGPNHYVQMVNATVYQIFNKSGVALTTALNFGALWPVGQACRGNLGDPIVVYDHLADRWVLSQFAQSSGGFFLCFAISQTPDPTANTWFLYQLQVPVFPDYPKIGVWPSGYFVSTYEGANLGVFAFDRTNMLAGLPAGFVRFTVPSLTGTVRDTRILPADLDGPAPPPGTPNLFVRTVDSAQHTANPVDRLEVFAFQPNFVTPASSTFTLAQTLTNAAGGLAPFNTMVCNRNGGGIRDCIPQPGTTTTVDALSNRPMMQLKFRQFATHQAMVFNQTIVVGGSITNFTPVREVAGLRWYELRNPGGGAWAIQQQGTYADQGPSGPATEAGILHRWMGSAAMNGAGDIALGYSISNNDAGAPVRPGIRYTGRFSSDAPGAMTVPEGNIATGVDVATSASRRWGDYSALSVDPADDCTFWFTTHLAPPAGQPHPTRIASFRLRNCGTDLVISKSHVGSFFQGQLGATYTIGVSNAGIVATSGTVQVDDTLPAGLTATAIGGIGWTCTLSPLRCTRVDPLAPGAAYANITLTVNVNLAAAASVTNSATVTAAGDINPGNNTANDPTVVRQRTFTTVSAVSGQYSDVVTLTANVAPLGVAGSVSFSVNGGAAIAGTYSSVTGIATASYTIPLGAGSYAVAASFTSSNPLFLNSTGSSTLTVSRENATVTPSLINPASVKVAAPGGSSPAFTLTAAIVEVADGSLGNISNAVPVTFTLTPLLSGGPINCTATTSGGGVGGTLTASCTFSGVAVDLYTVTISIGGIYYTGSATSLVSIYDPSLGFVTAGGTVLRGGVLANFGLNESS